MALDPLATLDDLKVRMKVAITSDAEEDRGDALLRDASAAVRNYTGQQFTKGTTTGLLLRPKNRVVRLPQRPVLAVSEVTDTHDNQLLYTWEGDDQVLVGANLPDTFAWEPWVNGISRVKVTYEHGYDDIPDDIVAIVCQITARAYGRAPEDSGVSQESIAGYSYSVGGAAAAGPLGMLDDERRALDAYRFRTIGTMRVAFQ